MIALAGFYAWVAKKRGRIDLTASIHWAKLARLAPSELQTASTHQLIFGIARVRALISWHLAILGASRWATAFR
jgi:hypothetical protein